MNSLKSSPDITTARDWMECEQTKIYKQMAIPVPDSKSVNFSPEWFEKYLNSNPDYTPEQRASFAKQYSDRDPLQDRSDVGRVGKPMSVLILTNRVDDLKNACKRLNLPRVVDNVVFGNTPAGGLGVSTCKIGTSDYYSVFIPDGFYHLINLFSKLVVLLQPFTLMEEGVVYQPSASFDQFRLARHPYIQFRRRDLLRAFFIHGDVAAALPYPTAVPFQDRLAYLLEGTEFFVIAHEVAHVILGHLDRGISKFTPDDELEADKLALEILTEHFATEMDLPDVRATLCMFMFLSIVAIWEQSLHALLSVENESQVASHHPKFEQRFKHYLSLLEDFGRRPKLEEATVPWYRFVHSAIRLATESERIVLDIVDQAGGIPGISASVLGPNKHMGHSKPVPLDVWYRTIAELILSDTSANRRLGLWFFLKLSLNSSIAFFDGLLDDDEPEVQGLYRQALISIEPRYEWYLPRLFERIREETRDGQQKQYKEQIAQYLVFKASLELGGRSDMDPMHPDFFNDLD